MICMLFSYLLTQLTLLIHLFSHLSHEYLIDLFKLFFSYLFIQLSTYS